MRDCERRRFKSSDGKHECYCVIVRPDGEPKGIVQISHGMCEYIDRYLDFMSFLADKGYVVCGNDHLGHGKTVDSPDELGYFGFGENGWKKVVEDLHRMTVLIKAEYPGLPLVLMGHSMGSFMARAYAVKHGSECAGFIFMGTSDAFEANIRGMRTKALGKIDKFNGAVGSVVPKVKDLGNKLTRKIDKKLDGTENYVGRAGIALLIKHTKRMAASKGETYRSKSLQKISFGRYNDRIKKVKTGYEWISREENCVKEFATDPLCHYMFTVNGWMNVAAVLWFVSDDRWYMNFPKKKTTLFIAGEEDPVGSYGKGVRAVFTRLLREGCDVKIKLYPGARHELLNELNSDEVYAYLAEYLDGVIDGTKES